MILKQELPDLAPRADVLDPQLVVLMVLVRLVALDGLFLISVAVIIGAMVISPLREPICEAKVFLGKRKREKIQHMMYWDLLSSP